MTDTYSWNGGTGSFNDPASWTDTSNPSNRAAPGGSDIAVFAAGVTAGVLGIGAAATVAVAGTATFESGATIVTGALGATGTVGIFSGSSLTVNGAGVALGNGASLTASDGNTVLTVDDAVIGVGGTASAIIVAGALVTATTPQAGSFAVTLGAGAGDVGSLGVDGSGTDLQLTGAGMAVGLGGTGMVIVGAGGTLTSSAGAAIELGVLAGASGLAIVSGRGSNITTSGAVLVGVAGTGGVTVASAGSIQVAGSMLVGAAAGGTGSVLVDGDGSLLGLGGTVAVGAGGTGTLTVQNGGNVAGQGELVIGVGGTAVVTGVNSLLSSSDAATGIGLSGGLLEVFNGGQVASTGLIALLTGTVIADGAGSVLAARGTMAMSVQAGTVTVQDGASLTAGGTVLIGNGGAITATGLGSSFSAIPAVAGADLVVGAIGAGTFDVIGQATAVVQTLVIATGSGSSGSVLVDGGATTLSVGGSGTAILDGVGGAGSVTIADGALLSAGGAVLVGAGGSGVLAVSGSGSQLQVTGSQALVVGSAGTLLVAADGQVTTAGTLAVSAGSVTVTDAGLISAGALAVGAGGSLAVTDGATLSVSGAAGFAGSAATISGGADLLVGSTLALAGALFTVAAGGGVEIGGATGPGSGTLLVDADGLLAGFGTILSDAVGTIGVGSSASVPSYALALSDGGTLAASGGTLDLLANLAGAGSVLVGAGAALALGGAAAAGMTIAFVGAGAHTLELAAPTTFAASITGAAAGDSVALGDSNFANGNGVVSATIAESGGTQTLLVLEGTGDAVADITGTLAIPVAGPLSGDYVLQAPGADGTSTVLHFSDTPPCFAAGTRIATARGEVPVEALRTGDRVATCAGDLRPVRWIGWRHVACGTHPRPDLVLPVRVRAGAFGPGLPRRDLLLSPDHSLFVDGVLVPVRCLLNGATVMRAPVADIWYYHVELDRHDVLLAEGLPAESYLDTGNRPAFGNGGAARALHPDFSPLSWDGACAPLCQAGPMVMAIRARLLARAQALGFARGVAAAPALLLDRRLLRPVVSRGGVHRFLVPPGVTRTDLVSAACVPAGTADCRQLGIALAGLVVQGRSVPLTAAALGRGFYPVEQVGGVARRWTDGRATLELPRRAGVTVLELLVSEAIVPWLHPADRARLPLSAGDA